MRNKTAMRNQTTERLLTHARYEVLPTASTEDKVLAHVPRDVGVTVTASGAKGLEATLALAETLARDGYVTVPHLAARMISGARNSWRSARGSAQPESPGCSCRVVTWTRWGLPGRVQSPGGPGHAGGTLRARRHHGIPRDASQDHRRPHRAGDVGQAAARHSRGEQPDLRRRRDQELGDPDASPRRRDARAARDAGSGDRTKLLAMASKIGVGESTRFLVKHKSTFARLAAPGGFTGERFLEECAPRLPNPTRDRGAAHLHVQPDRGDRGLAAGPPRPPLTQAPPTPSQKCSPAMQPTRRKGLDQRQRRLESLRPGGACTCTSATARAMFSCTSVDGACGRQHLVARHGSRQTVRSLAWLPRCRVTLRGAEAQSDARAFRHPAGRPRRSRGRRCRSVRR